MTIGLLLGGKGKPKGSHSDEADDMEMEDSEDSMEMPDGFVEVAKTVKDAASGDDDEAFAQALHDAIKMCC